MFAGREPMEVFGEWFKAAVEGQVRTQWGHTLCSCDRGYQGKTLTRLRLLTSVAAPHDSLWRPRSVSPPHTNTASLLLRGLAQQTDLPFLTVCNRTSGSPKGQHQSPTVRSLLAALGLTRHPASQSNVLNTETGLWPLIFSCCPQRASLRPGQTRTVTSFPGNICDARCARSPMRCRWPPATPRAAPACAWCCSRASMHGVSVACGTRGEQTHGRWHRTVTRQEEAKLGEQGWGIGLAL